MTTPTATGLTLGERFAITLAAKNSDALVAMFGDPLDFQALTPGRHWSATDGRQLVDDVILGRWFGPDDVIESLDDVLTGRVGSREHVGYRLRVRRDGLPYAVEQQLYYDADTEGRMTYARLLCSGYCRTDG